MQIFNCVYSIYYLALLPQRPGMWHSLPHFPLTLNTKTKVAEVLCTSPYLSIVKIA